MRDCHIELKRQLYTTRGQLWLIGATLAAAAVLAVGLTLARPLFERNIKERYPSPSQEGRALAVRLGSADAATERSTALPQSARGELYDLWMLEDKTISVAAYPRALMDLAPAYYRTRVHRTIVAGSPEQQRRAVEFAVASRHPSFAALMTWAKARAARRGERELAKMYDNARETSSE